MSNYFNPKEIKLSILDILKYDAVQDLDGVICKDMGSYVQLLVPMNNSKGHDTYEVYYDEGGKIEKVVGHSSNTGFSGSRYF